MTKSDDTGQRPAMSGQSPQSVPTGTGDGLSQRGSVPNVEGAETRNSTKRPGENVGESDVQSAGRIPEQPSDGEVPEQSQPSRRRRRRRRKRKSPSVHNGAVNNTQTNGVAANNSAAPAHTDNAKPAHRSRHRSHNHFQNQTAYAALDLGTNNCRLLVAIPTRPGQFRVIDAFSRIVRLGEGLGGSSRLSSAAMDRAVEALKVCRDKLHARPIERARLIATEACRSAENGAEFIQRVHDEAGLKLEIVDRETEARLAVSGCSSLVDRAAKSIILFDIGGGSSEIALVNTENHRGGRLANHIKAWTSLPVGVVTMAEKFGGGHHVTPERFNEMIAYAMQLLRDNANPELMASSIEGSRSVSGGEFHLIGTSGTVTTLAGVHLDLPRYDRRRVDGLWMSSSQVDGINSKLLNWSFEERSANACIGSDRADLVLAGCAILEAIRRVWPSDRLRVADRGLREGILTEMMADDGVWRRRYRNNRNRKHNERHKA